MPLRVLKWFEISDNIILVLLWMMQEGFSAQDARKFVKKPQKYEHLWERARRAEQRRMQEQEVRLQQRT
jgi:hypothetical protein